MKFPQHFSCLYNIYHHKGILVSLFWKKIEDVLLDLMKRSLATNFFILILSPIPAIFLLWYIPTELQAEVNLFPLQKTQWPSEQDNASSSELLCFRFRFSPKTMRYHLIQQLVCCLFCPTCFHANLHNDRKS